MGDGIVGPDGAPIQPGHERAQEVQGIPANQAMQQMAHRITVEVSQALGPWIEMKLNEVCDMFERRIGALEAEVKALRSEAGGASSG